MKTNTLSLEMNECLEQALTAADLFIDTLTAEYDAITQQDILAFETAVKNKLSALEALAHCEKSRTTLLENSGFKSGPDGMIFYLQHCNAGSAIPELWKKLLSRAALSRKQNRRNHLLVESFSRYTHKALCILRGENPEQDVYGPGGGTGDQHGSRSLAKA